MLYNSESGQDRFANVHLITKGLKMSGLLFCMFLRLCPLNANKKEEVLAEQEK
jgi:hypothetical protein